MKIIMKRTTQQVAIDADSPFVIIGEKINPIGREMLVTQLKERNFGYVCDLVLKQVTTVADLPKRHTINQAFLGLAISVGATCTITDAIKLSLIIQCWIRCMGGTISAAVKSNTSEVFPSWKSNRARCLSIPTGR